MEGSERREGQVGSYNISPEELDLAGERKGRGPQMGPTNTKNKKTHYLPSIVDSPESLLCPLGRRR